MNKKLILAIALAAAAGMVPAQAQDKVTTTHVSQSSTQDLGDKVSGAAGIKNGSPASSSGLGSANPYYSGSNTGLRGGGGASNRGAAWSFGVFGNGSGNANNAGGNATGNGGNSNNAGASAAGNGSNGNNSSGSAASNGSFGSNSGANTAYNNGANRNQNNNRRNNNPSSQSGGSNGNNSSSSSSSSNSSGAGSLPNLSGGTAVGCPAATMQAFIDNFPEVKSAADSSFGGMMIHQGGKLMNPTSAYTLAPVTWPNVVPGGVVQMATTSVGAAMNIPAPILANGQGPVTPVAMSAIASAAASYAATAPMMPDSRLQADKEQLNATTQQNADNSADMEQQQAGCAINYIRTSMQNFTVDSNNQWNKLRNQLFLPMAILLLLPGAIAAQTKAMVAQGIPVFGEISPVEGLYRSIVAMFLIPGTYLIMNYGIDLNNSIAYTIQQQYQQIFGSDMYQDAMGAHMRAFPARLPNENLGYIPNQVAQLTPTGSTVRAQFESGNGLAEKLVDPIAGIYQVPPDQANEAMPYAANAQRQAYNGAGAALATTWNILCAFQLCYMYYLWFVGPIMAALWVYPVTQLRQAFPNWCEGVITLCFWSLFWNTVVLLMASFRGIDDTGTVITEALTFLSTACVKFAFDFAGMVKAAGDQAAQAAQQAGGGSGGSGSGGGSSGGGGGKIGKPGKQSGPGRAPSSPVVAQPGGGRQAPSPVARAGNAAPASAPARTPSPSPAMPAVLASAYWPSRQANPQAAPAQNPPRSAPQGGTPPTTPGAPPFISALPPLPPLPAISFGPPPAAMGSIPLAMPPAPPRTNEPLGQQQQRQQQQQAYAQQLVAAQQAGQQLSAQQAAFLAQNPQMAALAQVMLGGSPNAVFGPAGAPVPLPGTTAGVFNPMPGVFTPTPGAPTNTVDFTSLFLPAFNPAIPYVPGGVTAPGATFPGATSPVAGLSAQPPTADPVALARLMAPADMPGFTALHGSPAQQRTEFELRAAAINSPEAVSLASLIAGPASSALPVDSTNLSVTDYFRGQPAQGDLNAATALASNIAARNPQIVDLPATSNKVIVDGGVVAAPSDGSGYSRTTVGVDLNSSQTSTTSTSADTSSAERFYHSSLNSSSVERASEFTAINKAENIATPVGGAEQQIIQRQQQNNTIEQLRTQAQDRQKPDVIVPKPGDALIKQQLNPLITDPPDARKGKLADSLLKGKKTKEQQVDSESKQAAKATLAEQIMYQNIRNKQRKKEQISEEELELMRKLGHTDDANVDAPEDADSSEPPKDAGRNIPLPPKDE